MPRLSLRFALVATAFLVLISAGCRRAPQPLTVTILHWNDFHAQNLPFKAVIEGDTVTVGGAAYLAALLDSLRAISPRPVALHAGDEFTGTPICTFTEGQSQIELLNVIQPDAFEVGNHEFDYGWDTLRERLAQATFPVLCGNVIDTSTGEPIYPATLILERGGVKIGIIGINTRYLAGYVLEDALPGLRAEDPIPLVKRLLDDLEPITDIQVALTHQGVEEDRRLAQGCPRLDVIVGGHRHARLFEPLVENGVPILQAGAQGQYLGFFQAQVDTAADRIVRFEGKLIPVLTESIRPREDIAALVKAQEQVIAAELDRVIGVLKDPWVRVYEGESNVGDWTADAMIKLTGRDIAFINSGGLRRNIPAGPVTVRLLWELHPFGNRLMSFDLSGEELREAIRYQAGQASRFVQVGGLRYRAKRGTGEILELTVGGKPVDPEALYRVVTNEYVVAHFDGYFGFDLGEREVTDLGWIDRDLVVKAFAAEGTVRSRIDGRIALID